jgi:hypothetical protein
MEMSQEQDSQYTVREVVAVFQNSDDLEAAIDKLASSGFARQNISVMAGHDVIADKLGHHFKQVKEIEDDAKVPEAYFVRDEEVSEAQAAAIGLPMYIGGAGGALAVAASGGALALAIAAATAGGLIGGGIGGVVAKALGDHHAKTIQSNLEAGGILLWVRVNDADEESKATQLLGESGGQDIHAHDIERTWGTKDVPLHDWQPDPLLR